jgi:Ca2+-binding EF-hand superfamily protein
MRTSKSRTAIASAFAALALTSLPASAGGIDYNAIFLAADVDLSASLSLAEFTTTLDAGISANAAARRFNGADRNLNGSIQLNEFLIFVKVLPVPSKAETAFEIADVNVNGSLTFDEFISTETERTSIVKIRRNYLRADANGDTNVTLAEYIAFKAGDYDKTFISIFTLADVDENDEVDLTEFGYAYARGTAEAKIIIRFEKKDVNDDGLLTRAEWNPGVRGSGPL